MSFSALSLFFTQESWFQHDTLYSTENFADRFALGIIDKDKRQVSYLNEFTEAINCGSLILHKHKVKPHYIIQICPAIEEFFIANSLAEGISLEDYELPTDFDALKKESKTEQSKKDYRFKNLFKAIKKTGNADFKKLANWVEYLRDNTYTARIEDLQ